MKIKNNKSGAGNGIFVTAETFRCPHCRVHILPGQPFTLYFDWIGCRSCAGIFNKLCLKRETNHA